jgi:hypothetical protein
MPSPRTPPTARRRYLGHPAPMWGQEPWGRGRVPVPRKPYSQKTANRAHARLRGPGERAAKDLADSTETPLLPAPCCRAPGQGHPRPTQPPGHRSMKGSVDRTGSSPRAARRSARRRFGRTDATVRASLDSDPHSYARVASRPARFPWRAVRRAIARRARPRGLAPGGSGALRASGRHFTTSFPLVPVASA